MNATCDHCALCTASKVFLTAIGVIALATLGYWWWDSTHEQEALRLSETVALSAAASTNQLAVTDTLKAKPEIAGTESNDPRKQFLEIVRKVAHALQILRKDRPTQVSESSS
jgi:hypothetical protein